MKDRISLFPGRVTLTPVAGQTNTYDMVRADQPTQEGSALNKAFFLPDELAAALGIGSDDPSVKDALRALLDAIGDVAATIPNIEFGSYTGAGKYGSSNPNSLTFSFAPKYVWITGGFVNAPYWTPRSLYANSASSLIYVPSMPTSYSIERYTLGTVSNGYGKRSTDGKTIYWYNTSNAENQLNYSGGVYHYIAIG